MITIEPLHFPWQTKDPFLFCAFHKDDYPKGDGEMGVSVSLEGRSSGSDFSGKDGFSMYHGNRVPGFPAHPHRGFETITIAEQGMVDHSDSLGSAGRFGNGDVQWMTAGKGVQHSEMFPLLNDQEPNPLVLFQIWLNLPKVNKMVAPHFSMLWHEDIPVVLHNDEKGNKTNVKIVCGTYQNTENPSPAPNSWAANPLNEVAIWVIEMEANAIWRIPKIENKINRSLYYYEGNQVFIDDTSVSSDHMVVLDSTIETVIQNGEQPSKFLLLQGKPLNETVAKYGPFVMNTNKEIQEAMVEYQYSQFGGWPWDAPDHTHEKGKGRFALHADGREEKR